MDLLTPNLGIHGLKTGNRPFHSKRSEKDYGDEKVRLAERNNADG